MIRRSLTLSVFAAALLGAPAHGQKIDDPADLTSEHVMPQSPADTLPLNHGAPALEQLLLKLRTRASMMLIVAHPDDEDGGFLACESRGVGARVAMLTLTRGEGGQNLMSGDFGDALGLIRTQELLAADRYMGVDQMFGTEADFGFSKTKEETLEKWTHDRVLYDAVRAVRLYRPLVLASVFVGGVTDGHGHHQVAGEITQEVFVAAADPKMFPEMIAEGLLPWAPLKVYARVPFSRVTGEGMYDYATGKYAPALFHNYITGVDITHEPAPTVTIHEGAPATTNGHPTPGMDGLSYVQFARQGLGLQKTQIGSGVRLAGAGTYDVGYTLMGTRVGCAADQPAGCPVPAAQEADLFEGIDTSLAGAAQGVPAAAQALGQIDGKLAEAQRLFTPENLELTAPPLRDALRLLDTLIATTQDAKIDDAQQFNLLHELRLKRVQLNQALVLAHGLTLTAVETDPRTAPLPSTLHTLAATLTLTSKSANSLRIAATQLTVNLAGEGIGGGAAGLLPPESTREITLRLPYLAGLPPTKPYFSRPSIEQPFYDIAVPSLRNAPATPAPIVAHAVLDDQGVRIDLAAIVPAPALPEAVPVEPLTIVPPVSLAVTPTVAILRPGESSLPVKVTLTGRATSSLCAAAGVPLEGKFGLVLPDNWTSDPESEPYDPPCPAASQSFLLTSTAAFQPDSVLEAQAVARANGRNYLESFRAVGYPGLTYTNYYTPVKYRALAVDVTTAPGLRVAYLPGTGDPLPDFLPNLGITPAMLTLKDLNAATLAAYDVVILGVRAYSAHPGLNSAVLKAFAQQGGVVLAQYMSGGLPGDASPYPIAIPGDPAHNVVVEAQPVTILKPDAPLLNWPNKIGPADFDHWVEERGHGFAASWDQHYQALLETEDPDQDPQRGGLLVAPVGKGAYIYCSYALYRQLPEGVPGAYRLLANLLSYVKNPQR